MRHIYQQIIDYLRKVNWELLLFLVLVLNVKLAVKIPAIVIFLFLNRSALKDKSILKQKFIWFYGMLILIALVNFLLSVPAISKNYLLVMVTGTTFWLVCAAAAILNSWFVKKISIESLYHTLTFFFMLNAAVTLCQLVWIMIDAGSINPYTYQGMHQKYFISTGDRMTGITFDVSTTNALINSFAVLYFLRKNKFHLVLICMTVLLLTASNFTFLLLSAVLLYSFVFQSSKIQKSVIAVCLFFVVIFLSKISPQNNDYVTNAYKKIAGIQTNKPATTSNYTRITDKPDSLLSDEEKKQKTAVLYLDSIERLVQASSIEKPVAAIDEIHTKPFIPQPNIHTEPFQRKRDTTALQKELLAFASHTLPYKDSSTIPNGNEKIPGKLVAMKQTLTYLKQHPVYLLLGVGMGNFASKLAFRTSAMQTAGGYPARFAYINDKFRFNHLELYLNYFTRDIEIHSLINSPNNVYDQLISEYGIIGLLAFSLFYAFWFLRKASITLSGIPLLLLMLGAFTMDYWFEQLSVVILFELMMLLNIKEKFEDPK